MNYIIDNPLVKYKLTKMRDVKTNCKDFKELLKEITALMMYEVGKSMDLKKITISTPLQKTTGYALKNEVVLVPILRAGLGMSDGISQILPQAKLGHIGLYRNEKNLKPVEYYSKLPSDICNSDVLVLDPMLATGGSVIKAIGIIKQHKPKSIKFIGLVGAPEGLKALNSKFPDVDVYLGSLDEKLNKSGYITPGLGDAGDRIYGTK